MSAHIVEVRPEEDYILYLRFSDGVEGRVPVANRINLGKGMNAALADPAFFRQVAKDKLGITICWPNGVDVCPDLLHAWARGFDMPEWNETTNRVAEDTPPYPMSQ